jgi:hypothetical protein
MNTVNFIYFLMILLNFPMAYALKVPSSQPPRIFETPAAERPEYRSTLMDEFYTIARLKQLDPSQKTRDIFKSLLGDIAINFGPKEPGELSDASDENLRNDAVIFNKNWFLPVVKDNDAFVYTQKDPFAKTQIQIVQKPFGWRGSTYTLRSTGARTRLADFVPPSIQDLVFEDSWNKPWILWDKAKPRLIVIKHNRADAHPEYGVREARKLGTRLAYTREFYYVWIFAKDKSEHFRIDLTCPFRNQDLAQKTALRMLPFMNVLCDTLPIDDGKDKKNIYAIETLKRFWSSALFHPWSIQSMKQDIRIQIDKVYDALTKRNTERDQKVKDLAQSAVTELENYYKKLSPLVSKMQRSMSKFQSFQLPFKKALVALDQPRILAEWWIKIMVYLYMNPEVYSISADGPDGDWLQFVSDV